MHEQQNVKLTSYSQPHVLQQRMHEAGLKHGDTVMADISQVRIELDGTMAPVMYFCPSDKIIVKEKITMGDGGYLPQDAIIIGDIKLPNGYSGGLFNLKNVKLHSNGKMQIIATADTVAECLIDCRPF